MWFQVEEEFIEHPKISKLRKKLNCAQMEAAGIVLAILTRGVRHASKEGVFASDDRDDIARYLAYVNAGSQLAGNQMVDALVQTGWIDETEGVLQIHDWDFWQSVLYTAREKRERDAERKRRSRQMSIQRQASETENETDEAEGQCVIGENGSAEGGAPPPPLPAPSEASKYPEAFEVFWKAYPRMIDKGTAYKKYQARRRDGYSDEELIESARNYAIQCRKLGTQKEYIKHPKTFLSDTLPFLDYLPKDKRTEYSQQEPDTSNPFAEYGKES